MKGPAVLLTEGIQNLRLDGLLTLISISHGNLGGWMNLTRYLEQMRENVKKFDMKRSTDSWNLKKKRSKIHTDLIPPKIESLLIRRRQNNREGRRRATSCRGHAPTN